MNSAKPKFKLPLWIIISSFILALLVGASFLIPQFLDQAKYKTLIQTKIKEASGYDVNWSGDIGVMLLPLPTATISNAEVSANGQTFLTLEQANVRVALMPLLQKSIEVQSITLKQPIVNLVTTANGQKLWEAQKPIVAAKTAANEGNTKNQAAIKIGNVSIENGAVTIYNQQTKSKQTVSGLDIDLALTSLDGPFDIKGQAVYNKILSKFDVAISNLPAAQKPTNIKGKITLPDLGAAANIDQTITVGDVMMAKGDLDLTISDIVKAMKATSGKEIKLLNGIGPDLTLKTNLSYTGAEFTADNLSLKTGALNYTGAVKVSELGNSKTPLFNINLQSQTKDSGKVDVAVKFLSDLNVNATARMNGDLLTLQNTQLTLDGQSIAVAGSIKLPKDKQKAGLNLTVSSPRLDLDDLQKQYAVPTESAAAQASADKKAEKISLTGFELPFNGNLRANFGALKTGGREFSNVVVDVAANGNALQINTLSLNAFAGTLLSVKGAVANTKTIEGLNLNVSAKTNSAEQLADTLKITMPKLNKPIGAVALNGNFTGSLTQLGFDATTSVWDFDITGKGQVNEILSAPKIQQLNARVRHANTSTAASAFTKGFTPPKSFRGAMDIQTTIAWDKDQYRLSGLNGRIGSTTINGGLTMTASGKPSIAGSLILGAVELDSNSPTAKGRASPAASSSGSARWSREAINTAWMRSLNADLAIQAQSLTQGGWRFDNPKLSFKLNDGELNIRDMSANMFGGSATLNGVMKAGVNDRDPLSINGALTAKNISAEKLHSAVAGVSKDIFKGTVNNFDLEINATGISPAALVQSLSGNGGINGQNIVIKGVDAGKLAEAARGSFKPLERAGSLYGSFQEGSTKFDTMKVGFDISSGVVNFSEINFDGATSNITSTGNLNLPRWTVDLNNKMTVKNTDIPPFEFRISGPLDSPLQTGGSIIENYLKQRAMKKVEKFIGNELEKRLGGELGGALGQALGIKKPTPAPVETAPLETAPTESAPTEPAPTEPAPAEPTPAATPDDALGNIIKDPSNIKTDDAIKALGGLLGQ